MSKDLFFHLSLLVGFVAACFIEFINHYNNTVAGIGLIIYLLVAIAFHQFYPNYGRDLNEIFCKFCETKREKPTLTK